jgi:hypothetical protein
MRDRELFRVPQAVLPVQRVRVVSLVLYGCGFVDLLVLRCVMAEGHLPHDYFVFSAVRAGRWH